MANIKYTINATEEQLDKLYKSLHVGSPLSVALKYAGISASTYYYWVATANVVEYVREQDFLKKQEEEVKSGITFNQIQEIMDEEAKERKSKFITPNKETVLKYKNNTRYHEYADKVYEIIQKCQQMQTDIVMYHLQTIRDAARQRGTNSYASQWFLERTLPNEFGRKEFNSETEEGKVNSVKVTFVDPEKKDTQDRVKTMEAQILNETKTDGSIN